MASESGQEGSLRGDMSPVLCEVQLTIDAASRFPGPDTGVGILVFNPSPHRNTTK